MAASKKADNRRKRKQEKLKRIKQREIPNPEKQPISKHLPEDIKQPKHKKPVYDEYVAKHRENPESIMQKIMTYSLEKADRTGTWPWGLNRDWSEQEWNQTLYPNLENYAKLKWCEICRENTGGNKRHKKHHDMNVPDICREAQLRLIEIDLDEFDKIFRFKIDNLKRIWGV